MFAHDYIACSSNCLAQLVDALLRGGADPNLRLGPAVGSALCAVVSLKALGRRKPSKSCRLVSIRDGTELEGCCGFFHSLERVWPGALVLSALSALEQLFPA